VRAKVTIDSDSAITASGSQIQSRWEKVAKESVSVDLPNAMAARRPESETAVRNISGRRDNDVFNYLATRSVLRGQTPPPVIYPTSTDVSVEMAAATTLFASPLPSRDAGA
jgi:hypothetical protein